MANTFSTVITESIPWSLRTDAKNVTYAPHKLRPSYLNQFQFGLDKRFVFYRKKVQRKLVRTGHLLPHENENVSRLKKATKELNNL